MRKRRAMRRSAHLRREAGVLVWALLAAMQDRPCRRAARNERVQRVHGSRVRGRVRNANVSGLWRDHPGRRVLDVCAGAVLRRDVRCFPVQRLLGVGPVLLRMRDGHGLHAEVRRGSPDGIGALRHVRKLSPAAMLDGLRQLTATPAVVKSSREVVHSVSTAASCRARIGLCPCACTSSREAKVSDTQTPEPAFRRPAPRTAPPRRTG